MKVKRTLPTLVLMLAFTFLLTACSTGRSDNMNSVSSSSEESVSEAVANSKAETLSVPPNSESADNAVLVAYFSYTGNTEEVARQIAGFTGGTLAEIQRAEDYGDVREEAESEILEGARPEITVSVDNVEDFDTVFVGYPIWWDEAPAMIATFLDSYDFSGKTIIPFCTSASDSIDNSLHIFSELCPDAIIADGLTANDEGDIEPWLQELGFIQ